jgi:hypothetical protein
MRLPLQQAAEAPLPSWERGGGEGVHATNPSPQPSPARGEGATPSATEN